jgi:hypothetical protein
MNQNQSKEQLLPSKNTFHDLDDVEGHQTPYGKSSEHGLYRKQSMILKLAITVSVILNLISFGAYRHARSQMYLCPSEYSEPHFPGRPWQSFEITNTTSLAGLGLTTTDTFWQNTEYNHPNRTISDAAWESIDTSPNTISLDKEYTRKHNLSDSIPFPWDPSRGLYIIKAFHHMHCLVCASLPFMQPRPRKNHWIRPQKNIRHAYNEALLSHPNQPQLIPPSHTYHCLDILRQDIMCRPDDTPMPTEQGRHKIGDGQKRKCKDWSALVAWTQDAKREACFKMFSDYRRMHTLEQFAFCNEGSRYTETMERYFREHGHQSLYLDEDPELQRVGGEEYW